MMSSQDRVTRTAFAGLQEAYAWLDGHIDFEKKLDRISPADDAFKLAPVRRLLESIGSPHRTLNTLHIAGTRGKGSSALALEALLRAAGFRVATFTSPHLYEYRERIRIDGAPIAAESFTRLVQRIANADARRTEEAGFQTVFEILTAAFFLAAKDFGADWVIVETGLGGRLDSTNVIDPGPVLLTRIGLEHTHILGNTPEAIATEKAGILKSGGWGVFTRQGYEGARLVFEARSRSIQAPLFEAESIVPCIKEHYSPDGMQLTFIWREKPLVLELPLYGPFLAENLQGTLALVARLEATGRLKPFDSDTIRRAWSALQLPGRMQALPLERSRDPKLFVDGAHCPTGALAVATAMEKHFGTAPATAVVGMMADKNHAGFFESLAQWPHWRKVLCCGIPHVPRAASASQLAAAARQFFPSVQECSNIPTGLQLALDCAEEREKIVALGSIYSVGTVTDWSRSYGRT